MTWVWIAPFVKRGGRRIGQRKKVRLQHSHRELHPPWGSSEVRTALQLMQVKTGTYLIHQPNTLGSSSCLRVKTPPQIRMVLSVQGNDPRTHLWALSSQHSWRPMKIISSSGSQVIFKPCTPESVVYGVTDSQSMSKLQPCHSWAGKI